ncbi:hotdog fold thioesterase [Fulvivirga sedimenti]|uniref:Hotdog fold thioesterase n=1 Tax=Fulvivirga sedimenti TaxID=2879465 RepID=A0A9X1HL28_9BACT|nr:hotdog fold thioesterase [Fulvivirga sedimenti]MCA6073301.1 hotdog fold thioesterase [Fulvivirga sedimenti]
MIKLETSTEELNAMCRNTIMEHLGIVFSEAGSDYIRATMPVDHRHHQPYGILHGGASVTLAETLGSMGAHISLKDSGMKCVGLEINANHLRSVRSGMVTGTARPIHAGRSTQVWEVHIEDEQHRLVCVSRITMAVLKND